MFSLSSLTLSQKFLLFSAAKWAFFTVWVGYKSWESFALFAQAMLGWTGGMVAAVVSGPDATRVYCQLSAYACIPIPCLAFGIENLVWLFIFWLGHIYFGFFEPPEV